MSILRKINKNQHFVNRKNENQHLSTKNAQKNENFPQSSTAYDIIICIDNMLKCFCEHTSKNQQNQQKKRKKRKYIGQQIWSQY